MVEHNVLGTVPCNSDVGLTPSCVTLETVVLVAIEDGPLPEHRTTTFKYFAPQQTTADCAAFGCRSGIILSVNFRLRGRQYRV